MTPPNFHHAQPAIKWLKSSRHGLEMGVFSQQLENPGFKGPMLFRLPLLIRWVLHWLNFLGRVGLQMSYLLG
jgi:hypothetical protein